VACNSRRFQFDECSFAIHHDFVEYELIDILAEQYYNQVVADRIFIEGEKEEVFLKHISQLILTKLKRMKSQLPSRHTIGTLD
jgi:hypothetical protein